MILVLTSIVFVCSTRETDGQTDGRTGGQTRTTAYIVR